MSGIFISFEGSDGCGKSTQIERLKRRLEAAGQPVLSTREPGGTELGEAIRHLLQTAKEGEGMCAETELLLFAASRAQLVRQIIAPALAQGKIVLADRFLDSTTVYQGVARRLEPAQVAAINAFALGSLKPHATLLFDLDPACARERIGARPGRQKDRMESLPPEFFEAVRAGYLALAGKESERITVIDADRPVDAIEADVMQTLAQKFHGLFH